MATKTKRKRKPWVELKTRISLCETALKEAAILCGPSFSYTLHAGWHQRYDAYKLARAAQVPDHPFGPYINVVLDADEHKEVLTDRPWWLVNDNTRRAFGSMGV